MFSLWGWYLQAGNFKAGGLRRFENAIYLTLKVFGLDSSYSSPDEIGDRWQLIVARWLGAVGFISGVVTMSLSVFRAQFAALSVNWRRGHILLIGDHAMANALASRTVELRLPAIHITSAAIEPQRVGSLINLPRIPGEDPLHSGRAVLASKVIIAEIDLGQSVEGALTAVERISAAGESTTTVAVHLDDPATAERIHHTEGGADLFAFSEAQGTARGVMLRHPPFLLANRIGAEAAHILIIGFGRLGQEMARDLVLNNLGLGLKTPHITVVDRNAHAVRQDFLHRHPEFTAICHFEVFAHLAEARLDDLTEPRRAPPVCAAYICLRDSAAALATAIGLRERAIRHELIQGPIFVRLRGGGLMRAPGGIAALQPLQLYGFGGLTASAANCGALSPDPDALARAVHESYCRIGGWSAGRWEDLPEEMRISNRRVISHIPAKLATLGFNLEPWLAMADDERPWPPALRPGVSLFRDDADRTQIAILEHERWMADRRLNGWRQGPARNNTRKIHTDFVPFEELSEKVKSYDYRVVDWMNEFLPRRADGLDRDGDAV